MGELLRRVVQRTLSFQTLVENKRVTGRNEHSEEDPGYQHNRASDQADACDYHNGADNSERREQPGAQPVGGIPYFVAGECPGSPDADPKVSPHTPQHVSHECEKDTHSAN